MDKYNTPKLAFEYAAFEPQGQKSSVNPGPETVRLVVYPTLPRWEKC